jgi:glucose-fructose oxidoreductase
MPRRQIRYAVVGLGHIAQVAMLPAFANSRRNSKLTALVSSDSSKKEILAKRYGVERTYSYDEYDACLKSGEIDAVYIALPNSLHCEYAVRAAQAGVHVLCEKPLAVTEEQCERMGAAAREAGVKLMTAYRLHFERANLEAAEIMRSGRLGQVHLFTSTFATPVEPGNIRVRVKRAAGGGVLWDIGIYCINAARNLFRAEPVEVQCTLAGHLDETEEAASATLRFADDRLASFACSFGADNVSEFRLAGTKGDLAVEPAYEYALALRHRLTLDGDLRERRFARRDQFAPELLYFSDCILQNREPEPGADEGLADVRVIRALYRSAETGRPVELPPYEKHERPSLEQEIRRPPVEKPEVIQASPPSGH